MCHFKLHNGVCKQLIEVGKYTSNLASRTELGRLPISEFILKETFNYKVKLVKCDENSLLHQCFLSEKILDFKGFITWYTNIKKFTQIQTSDNIDIKRALVEDKKEINRIYVNSMNLINGVTGNTATENNK